MTNLEFLLENDKESVVELLANHEPWGINKTTSALIKNCKHVPCNSCMFWAKSNGCNVERENWLNAEHEDPLLFPVGTVVEVSAPYGSDTTELRYYWGVYHGLHYACKMKSSLGQTLTNGHPICEFYDPATIRKVGD